MWAWSHDRHSEEGTAATGDPDPPGGKRRFALGEVVADVRRASIPVQFAMDRWEQAAWNRSVWPMIQLVMKPP